MTENSLACVNDPCVSFGTFFEVPISRKGQVEKARPSTTPAQDACFNSSLLDKDIFETILTNYGHKWHNNNVFVPIGSIRTSQSVCLVAFINVSIS